MKKTMAITQKQFLELGRDKKAIFFIIAFPVVFMGLFSLAFSEDFGGTTEYKIAIVNHDQGVHSPNSNSTVNYGSVLVNILRDLRYRDSQGANGSHVFNVKTDLTEQQAADALRSGDLDALVVIPQNFSEAVMEESVSYVQAHIPSFNSSTGPGMNMSTKAASTNATASVEIRGDISKQSFYTSSSIVTSVVNDLRDKSRHRALDMTKSSLESSGIPVSIYMESDQVNVQVTDISETSYMTPYDYMVPGMMVFGILMSGISVVSTLAEENSSGTLRRLRLTKMRSSDMLLGTLITYSVVSIVQVFILFAVALMLGYHANNNASLTLAAVVAGILGAATVALGLILAAFARNPKQAAAIGPLVTVPISFLAGAFFPMPNPTIIPDFYGAGSDFGLWDILPWTQGFRALTKVLTYGQGLEGIRLELTLLVVEGLIIFAVGVFLYDRFLLRRME